MIATNIIVAGYLAAREVAATISARISGERLSASRLRRRLETCGQPVVSFDIFNTILLRKCNDIDVNSLAVSAEIKALLGLSDAACDVMEFKWLRQFYFSCSRQGARREVRIREAYRVLLEHLRTSRAFKIQMSLEAAVDKIIGIETNFEIFNTEPNSQVIQLASQLRRGGRRVIAISDMYLPMESMAHILDHHGIMDLFDAVYLSSSMGVTKASGLIYPRVIQEAEAKCGETLHIGDSLTNDVLNARKSGLEAFQYGPSYGVVHQLGQNFRAFKRSRWARKRRVESDLERMVVRALACFLLETVRVAGITKSDAIAYCTRDVSLLADAALTVKHSCEDMRWPQIGVLAINRRHAAMLTCRELWISEDWDSSAYGNSVGALHFRCDALRLKNIAKFSATGALVAVDEQMAGLVSEFTSHRNALVSYLTRELAAPSRPLIADIGYAATTFVDLQKWSERALPGKELQYMLMASSSRLFDAGGLHNFLPLWPEILLDHRSLSELSALSFSWLEAIATDRSLGRLEGFVEKEGNASAMFAPGEGDSMDRQALVVAIAERATKMMKNRYLTDATVRRKEIEEIRSSIGHLASAPAMADLRRLGARVHRAGLDDQLKHSIIAPFNPMRMLAGREGLRRLVREDRWIAGSIARSGLGGLLPLMNDLLTAEMAFRRNRLGI